MNTYEEALRVFETARNPEKGKPLANNTRLVRVDGDTLAVRHQTTNVVTFRRGGLTTLNSGGWQTYTTKDRINRFSPAHVYQINHVWYVTSHRGGSDWGPAKGSYHRIIWRPATVRRDHRGVGTPQHRGAHGGPVGVSRSQRVCSAER